MYDAGLLRDRVRIHLPGAHIDGAYGRETIAGRTVERWAWVSWSRGATAMREGALDAYDTIMVRLRYDPLITRDCTIEHEGRLYRIDSLHASRAEGSVQLTCTEKQTE